MEGAVASHQKLPPTNQEQSSKLILLQLHETLTKNSMLTILQSFGIWSELGKWKSSVSGCLMSRPQIKKKKKNIFKCHLLLFYATTTHFSIRLWHVTKNGQLARTEKKLQSTFQSQTCTKERSWSLVVCCPSDPLQLSESQRNHYIWEVCSVSQCDAPNLPAAGTGQQNGPNPSPPKRSTTHCTTNASKIEQTELRSFTSSTVFTWPLAKWLPLQASRQLLSGKMLLQQGGGGKCSPSVLTSLNPKARLFMLQE